MTDHTLHAVTLGLIISAAAAAAITIIIRIKQKMNSEYLPDTTSAPADNPAHGIRTTTTSGSVTFTDTLGHQHTVLPPTPPVRGRITSHFGRRVQPLPGASTNHRATDIAVPIGTPVRAPWDGRITANWTDTRYGGGRSLKILHSNGLTTGYCHLSSAPLPSGTTVHQGDIIAYSGNTGNVTGPHLHLTLRDPSGNRIDPEDIFDLQA